MHLSSPLKVGDLTLRNRNIMASLTRNRALPTNVPTDYMVEYYAQRAKGGAGLILCEGALICPQGTEWPHAPGIWNEEHVRGWKKITDAVHANGSLIFCQLWHVGRVAHPDMPEQKVTGKPVPAPSAIAAHGGQFRLLPGQPGYVTPTAIEDPWTIVGEFRRAATMAKKAGFDGVELHSGTGYLPHQFLDYNANQRTDSWGGSVENRCRFGLEVIKALIDVWGPARVGIKVQPCGGYNDVGMPLPETIETFTYYITELSAMKIAYMQFVLYVPFFDQPATTKDAQSERVLLRATPHDVLAIYGALVKPSLTILKNHSELAIRGQAMPKPEYQNRNPTPTRLLVNAEVTPDEAEKLLAEGVIDGAVFGRPWITNPDMQKRIEKGLPLNTKLDFATLYNGVDGNPGVGYTDYPEAA